MVWLDFLEPVVHQELVAHLGIMVRLEQVVREEYAVLLVLMVPLVPEVPLVQLGCRVREDYLVLVAHLAFLEQVGLQEL